MVRGKTTRPKNSTGKDEYFVGQEELVKKVARRTGYSYEVIEKVIVELVNVVIAELANGRRVRLPRLITFWTQLKKGGTRTGGYKTYSWGDRQIAKAAVNKGVKEIVKLKSMRPDVEITAGNWRDILALTQYRKDGQTYRIPITEENLEKLIPRNTTGGEAPPVSVPTQQQPAAAPAEETPHEKPPTVVQYNPYL
jgi:bacterial DNA-binding protein